MNLDLSQQVDALMIPTLHLDGLGHSLEARRNRTITTRDRLVDLIQAIDDDHALEFSRFLTEMASHVENLLISIPEHPNRIDSEEFRKARAIAIRDGILGRLKAIDNDLILNHVLMIGFMAMRAIHTA